MSSFTHYHVIPNLYDLLAFVELTGRYFEKFFFSFFSFVSYNGSH